MKEQTQQSLLKKHKGTPVIYPTTIYSKPLIRSNAKENACVLAMLMQFLQ